MIFFIPKDKVPRARANDVTYGLITCLIRPKKIEEPNRTRLVAGGDRVHYLFDTGISTADLLNKKVIHQQHDLYTWGKIINDGH